MADEAANREDQTCDDWAEVADLTCQPWAEELAATPPARQTCDDWLATEVLVCHRQVDDVKLAVLAYQINPVSFETTERKCQTESCEVNNVERTSHGHEESRRAIVKTGQTTNASFVATERTCQTLLFAVETGDRVRHASEEALDTAARAFHDCDDEAVTSRRFPSRSNKCVEPSTHYSPGDSGELWSCFRRTYSSPIASTNAFIAAYGFMSPRPARSATQT